MSTTADAAQDKKHLEELLKHFHTAMLVTHTDGADLRARPLAVTLQDSRRYVSIGGTARITRDRALIDRLWSEAWKLWFPEGKDDPDLCIVEITPHQAEYWDQSGLAGVKFVLEAAKAYASGTKPKSGESGDHAKLRV
jgi:general stress protein 26